MAQVLIPTSTNNLHFKPIGMRVGNTLFEISQWCTQGGNRNSVSGVMASRVILWVGALGTAVISAIELVAMAAIGVVGGVFCLMTAGKVKFLEKFTLKALSYAVNSAMMFVASLWVIGGGKTFPFRSEYALAEHVMYVGSAFVVQVAMRAALDRRRGQNAEAVRDASFERIYSLLWEAAPDFLGDIVRSVITDFQDSPQVRNAITTFIQAGITNITRRFPEQAVGLNQIIQMQNNGLQINLHGSDAATRYQTQLQELAKRAYLEIYRDDVLAAAFKDPSAENLSLEQAAESGRTALEEDAPHVFAIFPKWVQWKELQAEIQCPEDFQIGYLRQFNDRKNSLVTAKRHVDALSQPQKEILKKKLLGLDVENNEIATQDVFREISALASPLLRGRLISRATLHIGNGNAEASSGNIFQDAMRQAREELARDRRA